MTLQFKSLAAAAALAMTPLTASSATMLFADDLYSFGFTLSPGGMVTYEFEVAEELDVVSFIVTGSGDSEDIEDITFDYDSVVGDSFDSIFPAGGISGAISIVPGFGPFAVGDTFSFVFNDGIDEDVGLTLTFETEAIVPPAIPLPAGVALLMSALGGLALWRRRQTEV